MSLAVIHSLYDHMYIIIISMTFIVEGDHLTYIITREKLGCNKFSGKQKFLAVHLIIKRPPFDQGGVIFLPEPLANLHPFICAGMCVYIYTHAQAL